MAKKKVKISSVKRAAHIKSKKSSFTKQKTTQNDKTLFMKKIGNLHQKNVQRKVPKNALNNVQNDDLEVKYEDVIDMLDGDDFDFLQKNDANVKRKRKQISSSNQETSAVGLEMEYASQNVKEKETKRIKLNLLPIKSRDGDIITRSTEIDFKRKSKLLQVEETVEEQIENVSEYEESDDEIVNRPINEIANVNPELKFISTTDLLIAREQEIKRQKYRIGIICSGILEKPEDKMRNFNALFELMDETSRDGGANLLTVRRLAITSIAEVFKDILPEYRVGQVDVKMQTVRKTTLERTTYENSLLQVFKKFLVKLEKLTSVITKRNQKNITNENVTLAEIAVDSLCEILIAHTYFNYVQNIAQLLVYMLNCNFSKIRKAVHKCFGSVFSNDAKFDMSLYIIRRINHLIKTKSSNVHKECITCLLSLKIKKIDLDVEQENEIKQKKLEAHRQRLLSLSKKERKRRKKLAVVNKELEETKAEENKKLKYNKITELIKMVFTIYFRILKADTTSKMLGPILEGLAEFAHVINIDFFADLVNVLNKVLEREELSYREKLHCIQTIFVIISGQGEVLNIDPMRFYQHFYSNMFVVNGGKNHNDYRIVLKTLNEVLVKRKKNMSSQRLMAFVKRLLTNSMHLLHNGTLATLGTIKITFQLTSVLDILLDTDSSVGSGSYDALLDDPEYCNASCTALYELTKLVHHYHPTVKKMAVHIANGVPSTGDGCLPSELGKLTPYELFEQFDSTEMVFNPAIPVPKQTNPKMKQEKRSFIQNDFKNYAIQILNGSSKRESSHFEFFTEYVKSVK